MWFMKSVETVLDEFEVNSVSGLKTQEAQAKLTKYGHNKLKAKPPKSLLKIFVAQLRDTLIYVLFGAALITLAVGEWVDTIIILVVVLLNAAIGVIQESKAEKALEALEKMTTPHSIVRRDGKIKEINSEDLVVGDIVILEAGSYVPADLRLIESVNLQIEESALTGESVPAKKEAETVFNDLRTPMGDQANMAFMSTLVTYGRGEGIVVATAMDTQIGMIARILDEDGDSLTPLQKRLEELGKTLGYIAIGITALIFVIAIIQGRPLFEMFLTAISLAVAAIPEGLPAIVAIVLALGVTRMSKVNAIVRKLPAVETLGSVSIICSDKTGTLTQNKMTVVEYYTAGSLIKVPHERTGLTTDNNDVTQLIKSLVLCSNATHEQGVSTGDPTEVALIVLGEKYNLQRNNLQADFRRLAEKPFDSERKLMSTLNQEGNGFRVHTKGALDNILRISTAALVNGEIVPLTAALKENYRQIAEKLSDSALRVLGVAFRNSDTVIGPEEMESDLTVVGLVGMIDPPRLEVKESIAKAKGAGITPVMITGDHKNTAVAIAKELGIASSIAESITGSEIDQLSEQEFIRRSKELRVFARVSPEHKVKIVKALQSHGNIVSMTGDGVNDAPSLKVADIGVAMGITGTDVAKGASDMILTDDNFTTIVHAIEEGRNIYNNIKEAVIFLLACNLGEVVAIFFAILFSWPLPLLATQILWINLVTDSLPAIALGVDPGDKDVMSKKPRNPKESFFAHGAGLRAVMGGILIGILTLLAFYLGLAEYGYSLSAGYIPDHVLARARTMAFAVLAGAQLVYSLSMRSLHKSVFRSGLFTNMYLIGAIFTGFALQLGVISIPLLAKAFKLHNLPARDWGLVLALSVVPFIVNELSKLIMKEPSKF